MQLGLTIPLRRWLNIKILSHDTPQDRRFCWDLHGITLHGRGCLLAVHCSSRYTFTLFHLSAAHWDDLAGCFVYGLRKSLSTAGFSQAQAEACLRRAGAPVFTKTHGRREVAFLNRAWEDVSALDYVTDQSALNQPLLDSAVNALPRRCAGHQGLGRSDERLRLDLREI